MISYSQHRAWLKILLIIVLTVSSCCFAQTARNPYDQQLQSLVDQWSVADAPAKAVLLDRIYRLREFVTDPSQVQAQLSKLSKSPAENALIRDEANWHLAQIALHEGQVQDAQTIVGDLGFVREWQDITGAENCTSAIVDRTRMKHLQPTPLASVIVHTQKTLCAATAIYSASSRNVALRFGADGPISLYLNGHKAKSFREGQDFGFDQTSTGVQLRAGWNTLVVELSGDTETKEFGLRVTLPNGGAVSLQSDAARVSSTVSGLVPVEVADLLDSAVEKDESPESLDTLASIEQLRGLGKDSETLESAAKQFPTAARWIAVADACPNQSCKFAALNRALDLDTHFAAAKVALAEYYSERGQLEKSRDLLVQVVQSHPADFVARKHLADLYNMAGANALGAAEYRQLESDGHIPLWLKREIAMHYAEVGMTSKATALLNDVWASCFDDQQVRNMLSTLAERRGDRATLQMLAQSAEVLDPSNPEIALEVARYSSNPDPLPSSALSNDADLHLKYADMLAFAGEQKESRAELVKASTLDGRIQLPGKLVPAVEKDAPYILDPAKVAAEARRTPPTERSNVVSLADVNVERVLGTGQSIIHAQQIFYISNARGARDYGVRSIQYSHATQKLNVLSARVYKADGRVLDADDQGESSVADTSVAMYYDTRSRSFRFPTLEKGDVISLEYRISPNSTVNPYGNYFGTLVAFQNGLPQRLRRYVLIADSERKLNVVEQRMPVRAVVTKTANETIYRWDVNNIAPLTTEPRGPSVTEVAPYVSISTFENWNQLGRWYAKMITPQFALDGDLREALARITADAKTEQDKIHAIHEFVLRNTHYVAMEFGVYSYKPYPVSQVYARRFGDCKDKASLMIALLRAVGVDAELALVRTRKMGDVSDRATNIAVFNHAVAYIPKYDLWLDGTAEYAGSRELPLDDQGAMALTVNLNGDATLRRIPVTLPMQNYTHRVVRAEVQNDGNILFSGSAYTRGEDAPGLRREYEMADRQRDTVRANLAQVYPSVRVDAVHVEGAHDLERDINVKFSGSLDKFAGNKVLGLTSSWLPHQYVNLLAPRTTRSQDLLLPAPWTTEEELHFVVPEGANIDSLPANLNYETPFGTAVIRYERKGRELVVTTSVQFRKLRITPSEYGGFREFCSQVEKAFRREVKVRLAG